MREQTFFFTLIKLKIMYKRNNNKRIILTTLGALALMISAVSCKCGKKHTAEKAADADNNATATTTAATAIAGTLDAATGNFIYDTGELFSIKLPNGIEIPEIGKNSTETKLFNFLNDSNATVSEDKTQGWITFDRVYFETGKSTLTPESAKQVKNIAEILKAFPKAKAKIGGYTDNTGSAETNKVVSTERAKVVADELVKQGVAADQLASEGYGPEHPVCPANDTPECKAQNRRVDLRITEK